MFKREIEPELKELAKGYPIVTVIGPRQSGKTTLVRHTFPKREYANLELPDVRAIRPVVNCWDGNSSINKPVRQVVQKEKIRLTEVLGMEIHHL